MVARGGIGSPAGGFSNAPEPSLSQPRKPKRLNSHRRAGTKVGPGCARSVQGGCVLVAGDQPFARPSTLCEARHRGTIDFKPTGPVRWVAEGPTGGSASG